MDDLILLQRRYPKSFLLIFLSEVCQVGGVLEESTCRMLMVSDQTNRGQGHP